MVATGSALWLSGVVAADVLSDSPSENPLRGWAGVPGGALLGGSVGAALGVAAVDDRGLSAIGTLLILPIIGGVAGGIAGGLATADGDRGLYYGFQIPIGTLLVGGLAAAAYEYRRPAPKDAP